MLNKHFNRNKPKNMQKLNLYFQRYHSNDFLYHPPLVDKVDAPSPEIKS